jgi:hypothetical protein
MFALPLEAPVTMIVFAVIVISSPQLESNMQLIFIKEKQKYICRGVSFRRYKSGV